jgi:hypothetical protein
MAKKHTVPHQVYDDALAGLVNFVGATSIWLRDRASY